MRRTRADINQQLNVIRTKTGRQYFFDVVQCRPRLIDCTNGGNREVSPRLTTTAMYEWLNAFDAGIDTGIEKMRADINVAVEEAAALQTVKAMRFQKTDPLSVIRALTK